MHASVATTPAQVRHSPLARLYRPAALVMAISFAVVGLLFLVAPDTVIAFFNSLSSNLGFPPAAPSAGFYLVLAVSYMVVVTVLAAWMFVRPANTTLPVLLVVAKAASSFLSFGFFAAREHALIYLANGVVDGLLAVGVLALYLKRET